MKDDKFVKFLIIFFGVFIVLKYLIFNDNNLVYLKSPTDEDFHLVQNLPNKMKAADIMADIKDRIELLLKYLKKNYPKDPRIQRLFKRYDEDNIQETNLNDKGTSYSIDKGEQVNLCLRDKKTQNLHRINILMFVTLHELAHIMSKSYGHNEEHHKNFKFLLINAIKIGIYNDVNYSQNKTNFCGMVVDNSPLH
jgi:hypothetical protein